MSAFLVLYILIIFLGQILLAYQELNLAVHVRGGEKNAREIADRNGYRFLGQVVFIIHIYML